MYFMVPYKAVSLGPSLVQGQLQHPQFKRFSIKYLVPTSMGPCAGYFKTLRYDIFNENNGRK